MTVHTLGPYREYPTGAVYRGAAIIGHRAFPDVPLLSRRGEGCGPGWRIEHDPGACREFDRLEKP